MTTAPTTEKTEKKQTAAEALLFGHAADLEKMRSFQQQKMAINRIVIPEFDSRAAAGDLDEAFVDSLRPGLWQPIVLVPIMGTDKYMVVAGRRRLRGYIALKRTEIPYVMPDGITLKDVTDQAGLQIALQNITVAENAFRKGLNDWDIACTMLAQKRSGLRQDKIAEMWGRKPPYVSQKLSLFDLAKPVQELVQKFANDPGTFSKARKLLEVTDPDVQVTIAADAFNPEKEYQVRDVEALVERFKAAYELEQQKQKEREAAAKAGPAKKESGAKEEAADTSDKGAKGAAKQEKDPYAEAKLISISVARQFMKDHAAKVKKMQAADGQDPVKLAYEKGKQDGMELMCGVKDLPKVYTDKK